MGQNEGTSQGLHMQNHTFFYLSEVAFVLWTVRMHRDILVCYLNCVEIHTVSTQNILFKLWNIKPYCYYLYQKWSSEAIAAVMWYLTGR